MLASRYSAPSDLSPEPRPGRMKFLCPSCKAKYQIADEKVAGRSVRMKCRKCGKEIRVSSADALSSASEPPRADELSVVDAASQVAAPPPASERPAPEKAAPEKAASEKAPAKASPARAPMKSAPGVTPAPAATKSATATGGRPPPRPLGGSASKTASPGILSRPLTRTGAGAAPAKKVETPSPEPATAQGVVSAASGNATPRPANVTPIPGSAAPTATASPQPPRVVTTTMGRGQTKPPGEVKPVVNRAAPAPAPAAAPKPLNEEYGDEEQTQIADAGALAGAFSKVVTAQQAQAVSDPLTMPGDEWFVGINGVPVGPIHLSELRAKAGTGSITKESLVWRDGFEEWRPLKSFPELAAIVEESVSSAQASIAPPPTERRAPAAGLEALADPFAGRAAQPAASAPGAVTGAAVVTDDLDLEVLRARPKTGRAAWLAVVVALLFGISLGFVVFSRKPAEVVRYVEVPAKVPAAAPAPTVANEVPIAEPEASGNPGKSGSKGPLAATKTQPVGSKVEEGQGSKLTGGLRNLGAGLQGGPGGPGGNQSPSAGSQLEAAQVQQVVSRYTSSVKRSCWQPALDTRDKDAPSSARVVVSIQVGPSGSVQSVSTSGDPRGYRGLANCIAGRVRGWQFPASGSTTPVNVPFVFVAQ